MDKKPTPDGTRKKHIGGELVIPVAGSVFAVYYFTTIVESPWTAQVSAFFIGFILIALSLLFVIKAGLSVIRGEADLSFEILLAERSFLPTRLGLFGVTIGYIVVIHWFGFTLTTFLFLALSMLLLSGLQKLRFVLLLAASLALGGWLLFIVAFGTRFPAGFFENFMKQVM